ncbi:hypothetical protein [Pararhodospirillum photometricum]|uniref:hypothetical protein n=1 Tax=Pararhodospirillum photometricum TaxID=1084 RepID=UPI00059F0C33|nr:hypothetical protein [Pararhodospirillum photometricum]
MRTLLILIVTVVMALGPARSEAAMAMGPMGGVEKAHCGGERPQTPTPLKAMPGSGVFCCPAMTVSSAPAFPSLHRRDILTDRLAPPRGKVPEGPSWPPLRKPPRV